MSKVSLRAVSKSFIDNRGQEVTAVRDVNIEVAEREFLVLVGPSGCGKSTTLRMIAGLEEITSGDIAIEGRRVNDVPPKDRDIAMVFQSYALYPHMSVYDNMAFGLKLRGYPKAEIKKRVQEAANILGLESYLERKPKALSGGQRQRVAVGRAIVRQPKVFLFDEPLSNLDAKMRVQTRMELIRLHQRLQATMIYVTHDQVEAMTMGTRIAVMQGGLLQQIAPPLELYHQPRNLFVAGFLGSPPMNFVHGTLASCSRSQARRKWSDAPSARRSVRRTSPMWARRSSSASGQKTSFPSWARAKTRRQAWLRAGRSFRRSSTSSSRWVPRRISTCKRAPIR